MAKKPPPVSPSVKELEGGRDAASWGAVGLDVTFANRIYEGWQGTQRVMLTWLQSHPLDGSQELLLLLELLLLYTSVSLC